MLPAVDSRYQQGALKKSDGPDVLLINFRGTNQPRIIISLDLFFFRESSQKIDKKFDVSSSSTFFVLSRFQVLLGDGSSKTLQKTFYKKIVSKSFYEKNDQKSQTDFFSIFFNHVFGRFSVRGVQKHDKKISEKIWPTLVLFWPPRNQPTT
jgi:hypothetical protein